MILIVDDKPENLYSLKQILEVNSFKTDTAQSGEEALKKVLKNNYALILLDVQMPGMDGFEVAESITSLNKTKDIPIIFLSAVNTHKRFVTKGFESGAVDYITKPVDPDILILKVRNLHRLYEKTDALKKAEKALTATVNELHTTLESLPQVAFTANAQGKVEFVNNNWFQFASTMNTFPEVHPEDGNLGQRWKEWIQEGKPIETEIRLKDLHTGAYCYHLLRVTPVRVGDQLVKWVGTLTDIQHQKSLNEVLEHKVAERTRELLEMNRELEIINHDLQQFASVASHDLKEPLRKILFFGNLIKDRAQFDETIGNYLNKILRSSERMSNLIGDLLNFTRLSAADIFEICDLNRIIDEILNDLELTIKEKGATINVEPIPRLEVVPGLMHQLFQNILSNALKFSRPDVPPVINITAELVKDPTLDSKAASAGAFCRITIADNGIGFDEQYRDKIFTIFQRLNAQVEYEGTGIGLAIAKKIVDKHNGLIDARSRQGEGASFYIILPTRQPADSTSNIDQNLIAQHS
ncbi:response regulator [Flavisolibacter ginsengisoli]|jgi:signal transduction histidine kinase/CheY-like chemotaxis protein|uniref:histidine kinase n=1 Tax=Flavisolibacter ginsengisoli DSM 18119 TaxID=1121884 RepID=A0A1M4TY38_9BACT|nr:response regulator [Flavisolibacter ginsengisoli]SHE49358.1 PAS fold-containing protein [Flavisolibacter ginsengisoli DSM 18119]